jgi:hypothetical protein
VVLLERSGSSDTCQAIQLRRLEEALFTMLKERHQHDQQLITEFPSRLLSREVASVRICQPTKEIDLAKARYNH